MHLDSEREGRGAFAWRAASPFAADIKEDLPGGPRIVLIINPIPRFEGSLFLWIEVIKLIFMPFYSEI